MEVYTSSLQVSLHVLKLHVHKQQTVGTVKFDVWKSFTETVHI